MAIETTIKVDGARELRRTARRVAGADGVKLITKQHKTIAERVAVSAEARTPKRSNKLARSVRGLGSTSKASVAAGRGMTSEYAGVIHYGNPHRGIDATPFITDAVRDEWDGIYSDLEDAYEQIARKLATT